MIIVPFTLIKAKTMIADAPRLFFNEQLMQNIKNSYALGAYTPSDFCRKVTEGQIFFFCSVTQGNKFECEIDSFRIKEIRAQLESEDENVYHLILVAEYCDEERKGQEKEWPADDLFKGLNACFIVNLGERSLYAGNSAKAYRRQLEEKWDKLWVPYN
ncbi:MAG: hypothetical protein QG583_736 [Patescibacteria group bacterium]|nr:hypothetical protein [Patescibacteria group bacterium]